MNHKTALWIFLGTPLIAAATLMLISFAIGFLEEYSPAFCRLMADNQTELSRCGH